MPSPPSADRSSPEGALQSQSWKLEALGRLAAGLAHELNNVLQDLVSNIELARDDLPPGSPGHDYAERAVEAAMQAAVLTDRVALFGRTVTGTESPGAMLTGLEVLLTRTVGNAATVSMRIAPNLSQVQADMDRVRTAVIHAVLDTANVLPRHGTVRVAADPSDGGIMIAISGLGRPGSGIPPLHPLVRELGGRLTDRATDETSRIEIHLSP